MSVLYIRDKNGDFVPVPALQGEDGGYYVPHVDDEGNLSWAASEVDMPSIASVNIKGKDGENGKSGVHVDNEEPTDPSVNVWIDPDGEPDGEIPEPYVLPVASADTLGGVKVGEGLQIDGGVLGVKPEPELELIESREVAEGEEIKGFSCTKRLKDFELTIEVPASSASVTGGVEIYKRNREFAAYIYMGQIVYTQNVLCVINSAVVNGKSVVNQIYNQWNVESSKAQVRTINRTALMTDVNEPFTAISLYSSAPFPAGTKFVLRGVLADG